MNPNYIHYERLKDLECVGIDDFEEFAWFVERTIGLPPSAEYKLNRIDPFKGWVKGNIRWALPKQVSNTQYHLKKYPYKRKQYTLSELADIVGINYITLYNRVSIWNWPLKKALHEPINEKFKSKKNLHKT